MTCKCGREDCNGDTCKCGDSCACKMEDRMDDLVDEWHNGDSKLPLHEYLGMTWEEYSTYVERGL